MAEGQWKKIPKEISGELYWANRRRICYAEVSDDTFVLRSKNHRNAMHVIQQIPLNQMAEIVEIPKKLNQPECFKILLKNCNEEVFNCRDKGNRGVQRWVENLRHAKQFWKDTEISNKLIVNKKITLERGDEASRSLDPNKSRAFFTLWDGEMVGLLVDDKSTFNDMYPKIFSSACPRGACSTCRLRHQTSKLWAVDNSGTKRLVDKNEILMDLNGNMLYVLEHRQKLLIVHFTDHYYVVLPAPVSITAEEVLELAPIATKLEHLGCLDPGLFLQVESGSTELPFQRNDRPFRYEHGLFIARSRAKRANSKKKSKEEAIAEIRRATFLAYHRRQKINAVTKENLADQIERSTNDNCGLIFDMDHFALEKPAESVDVPYPRDRSRRMVAKRRAVLCDKRKLGSQNRNDVSPEVPTSNTRVPNVPVGRDRRSESCHEVETGSDQYSAVAQVQSFGRSEKNMATKAQPSVCNSSIMDSESGQVDKFAQVCGDEATLQNKAGKHISELRAQLVKVPVDHNSEVPVNHNSEVPVNHNSEVPVDHNSEVPVNHNSEVPVDHNSEVPVNHNSEVPVDHNSEVPVNHNSEVPVNHNSEVPVDHNSEVPVNHNSEVGVGHNSKVLVNHNSETTDDHMPEVSVDDNSKVSEMADNPTVDLESQKTLRDARVHEEHEEHGSREDHRDNEGTGNTESISAAREAPNVEQNSVKETSSTGSVGNMVNHTESKPRNLGISNAVDIPAISQKMVEKLSGVRLEGSNASSMKHSVSEPEVFSNERRRQKRERFSRQFSAVKFRSLSEPDLRYACARDALIVSCMAKSVDAIGDDSDVDVRDVFSSDHSDYSDGEVDFPICTEQPATSYEDEARSAGPCWKLAKRVEIAVERILRAKEDFGKVNKLIEGELSPTLLELFECGRKKSRAFWSSFFSKAVDVWKIIRAVSAGDSTARRILSKVEQRTELCFLHTKFLQLIRACVQHKYLGQWFELVHQEDMREKISGFYESDALLLEMARSPAMEHLKLYLDKLNVLVLKEVRPLNKVAHGLVVVE